MRVLLDTDVVLDLILDRQPFVEAAAKLFELHEQGRLDIFISSITPINVFYITRKNKGLETARLAVAELLAKLGVCALDRQILQEGHNAAFKDFEDAVQYASALASDLEVIVTRNVKDYKNSSLPIFSPTDFLVKLESESA